MIWQEAQNEPHEWNYNQDQLKSYPQPFKINKNKLKQFRILAVYLYKIL